MRVLTHYELLNVDEYASPAAITAAFREKAKRAHPDANGGSAAATETFKRLSHAHDVLKDPAQRAAYDRQLAFERATRTPATNEARSRANPSSGTRAGARESASHSTQSSQGVAPGEPPVSGAGPFHADLVPIWLGDGRRRHHAHLSVVARQVLYQGQLWAPSTLAEILTGRHGNGWKSWRDAQGRPIDVYRLEVRSGPTTRAESSERSTQQCRTCGAMAGESWMFCGNCFSPLAG